MCLPSVQEGTDMMGEDKEERDIFTVYEGKGGGGRLWIYCQTSTIIYQRGQSNSGVHAVAHCHPKLGRQARGCQCLLYNTRATWDMDPKGDREIITAANI